MVKLARDIVIIAFKIVFFVVLFVFSMRFIHTYPLPMPPDHQHKLSTLSQKMGIVDPGDLYVSAVGIVNLIAATVEYRLLMRFWRKTQRRRERGAQSRKHA